MPVVVRGNSVVEKATGKVVKRYTGPGAHAKAVKYEQALNIAYAKSHGHRIATKRGGRRGGKGSRKSQR